MPRISFLPIYSIGKIPTVGILLMIQLGKYFGKKSYIVSTLFGPIVEIQCMLEEKVVKVDRLIASTTRGSWQSYLFTSIVRF